MNLLKIIFGLGNPGQEFLDSRHNLGFWLIEQLNQDSDFRSFLDKKILRLEKNSNFMNSAGEIAKRVIDTKKVPLNNFLVAHDDWDLAAGTFKLQKNRGSARHKGVQSVIDALGSKNFWRLRIGIGPAPTESREEFVLERVTKREWEQLGLIKTKMLEAVKRWLSL